MLLFLPCRKEKGAILFINPNKTNKLRKKQK